ncbi:hypothetical protein ASZ90_013050 [hydrocarbon metagenome]|jgi:hypothetical protein|uniref:Uncharacterized protein n=1 Tax=hydrocarbon metagenome TaxID=938273 RepID=A0A0W8F8T7_9ZZZZ
MDQKSMVHPSFANITSYRFAPRREVRKRLKRSVGKRIFSREIDLQPVGSAWG